MRGTKRKGGFFLCLAFNMLINFVGLIPSVILLILHFWLNISVCEQYLLTGVRTPKSADPWA